jgi:parallel beta-helix repeat protein
MSREAVFIGFLLLFLLVVHAQSAKTARAGRIWTVDDDGPADFQTIQEAVNAASEGDAVFVHSGTYLEHVSITKTISLFGENSLDTIVDTPGTSISGISIEADNVTVKNFTVRNTNLTPHWSYYKGGGIYLDSVHGCDVENCVLVDNTCGINLVNSSYNNISNNLVAENGIGIPVWEYSSNNLIKGNWVLNNFEGLGGVALGPSSKDNTVVENYLWNNTLHIDGDDPAMGDVFYSASGVVACNNFVENATVLIDYYYGNWQPQPDIVWSMDGHGNFWIGYSGVDADGDGLGDTPYIIDESNNDSFPLMRPYKWITGDVNYDMVVNILDLFAMARAFDSRPGDVRWNLRCDLNNDRTINILDVFTAASHFREKMNWPPP